MEKLRELFVVVENQPGAIGRLCTDLSRRKINIEAIGVFGDVAKLSVSNTKKAMKTLFELGYAVEERDVLKVELSNQPGALSEVANKLGDAGINIEYCYGTIAKGQKRMAFVLDVSDISKALSLFAKKKQPAPSASTGRRKAR